MPLQWSGYFVAAWSQNTALALVVPSVVESRMAVFDSLIVDAFSSGIEKKVWKFCQVLHYLG